MLRSGPGYQQQFRSSAPRPITGRVLIIDDTQSSLKLLTRVLERDGHHVIGCNDSRDALSLVANHAPDVVLLDIVMPAPNGLDLCRELKQNPTTLLVPVVLVTALTDPAHKLRGIDAGADDFLIKPVNTAELLARVRSLIRLKRYTDDLESAESVILSLALTIEARDASTDGHCQRLASYATAVGRSLGLDDDALAALNRGGFLHDVGKIGIPDAILLKTGRLTADEFRIMQRHTVIGDRLCGELRSLRDVRVIVRHHHERCDGSGYPDGLVGDRIPLLAQIMSVVDVYDALTTDRPYRRPMTPEQAFDELRHEVACGWKRADLVDAFIELVRRNPQVTAAGTLR